MIPIFPKFKRLELSDEREVERIVGGFKLSPYADFYFVNMWIWDTSNSIMISTLNENLVVVFSDYLSNEPVVSFIGRNKLPETAIDLLKFSKAHYHVSQLKLIPEEIATELSNAGLKVDQDEDSHDYVYLTENLANMHKWSKNSKAKNIRRFIKKYPSYEVKKNTLGELPAEDLKMLFKKWSENKSFMDVVELNEYKAFERLLRLKNNNIKMVSLYISGLLVGSTVFELVPGKEYALSRFAKADTEYDPAIYDILNWEEAKLLKADGIKYYNWEQDLGIPGLRYSKMKYKPVFLLKKFIVSN